MDRVEDRLLLGWDQGGEGLLGAVDRDVSVDRPRVRSRGARRAVLGALRRPSREAP